MSNLKAIKRENTSSGSNNKLRADGLIPAILYGGKNANQNISVEKKDIKNLVNSNNNRFDNLLFLIGLILGPLIYSFFSKNEIPFSFSKTLIASERPDTEPFGKSV